MIYKAVKAASIAGLLFIGFTVAAVPEIYSQADLQITVAALTFTAFAYYADRKSTVKTESTG